MVGGCINTLNNSDQILMQIYFKENASFLKPVKKPLTCLFLAHSSSKFSFCP